MDKENVIFLAHFQPFHNGHVSALAQVCAPEHQFRRLFVAVASSDIDNTRDNPFSFGLFFSPTSQFTTPLSRPSCLLCSLCVSLPFFFFLVPHR